MSDFPEIPYEEYRLENGLRVILAQDRSAPIVHVNVWYHVGSSSEKPGLSGFAHLFEHLMFQGSPSNPDEYFAPLNDVGANLNGTTTFDRTNYYEEVPAEYLPLALFLESDRMGWLLETLDQGKLDNQREVVRNERRQRYENPPYGEVNFTIAEAIWPKDHPYYHLPIGSHTDLEAADLGAVKDFFKTWYAPDNASLVVTGDFETKVAKKLIAKYFDNIPKGPERVRPPVPPTGLAESKVIREYDQVPKRKVWMNWLSPALAAPGDADLDLFSSILTDGKDSRLYYRLVKETGLATEVAAYQQSRPLGSIYTITATAAEGHTTDEIVMEIERFLKSNIDEKPITVEEVDAARAGYERAFFEAIATIGGKADLLNGYATWFDDPGHLDEDLARYTAATPGSVLLAAKDVLGKPSVIVHILPEADKPPETPTTPAPTTPGGAP